MSPDELKEDGEYDEIVEDMREECGKYGKLALHAIADGVFHLGCVMTSFLLSLLDIHMTCQVDCWKFITFCIDYF